MTLAFFSKAAASLATPSSVILLSAAHTIVNKSSLLHPAATFSCHSRLLTAKVDLSDARVLLQGSSHDTHLVEYQLPVDVSLGLIADAACVTRE